MVRLYCKPLYKVLLVLLGLPTFVLALASWMTGKKRVDQESAALRGGILQKLEQEGVPQQIRSDVERSFQKRNEFFGHSHTAAEIDKQAQKDLDAIVEEQLVAKLAVKGVKRQSLLSHLLELLERPGILAFSVITSLPMYLLLLICYNPFVRYAFERIVMMVFVVFGVILVVFTILHASPMDPAVNILGEMATEQQIADFDRVYGLDQPYLTQLVTQFKKFITFDLGNSYSGNEVVVEALMRKFPVTLKLAFFALLISVVIALPVGIISAIRPYTAYDYVCMFFALVGLSVPAFWFGMIMILIFSINLGWLPASFDMGNPLSYVMPSIVMGTNLAASLTRMTRSSVLEVINQDYIVTARAKGLNERTVIVRHALSNAMIPIVTIIGLQFGNMLGGSAVTEKVFNIKGIGSYIIEKQFLPDIPIILSGVVYVAVIISVVNLVVDLLYAALDPRIKSKIKNQ